MRTNRSSQSYARAAYEVTLEGWQKSLQAVHEKIRADESLRLSLHDPQLDLERKRRLLDEAIPPGASREVRHFLYLLLEKGRLEMLDDILIFFALRRLVERGAKRQVAEITSAVPLTEEEQEALQENLRERFGPDLEFLFRVDPALLGGVVVRLGDQVIDGSVAGKLNALRESLRAAR